MVLKPTWRELACRDFDMWLGETGLGISTQLPCDSRRTLKACQGMSDNGRGSLGSHFNYGKGGLFIVVFTKKLRCLVQSSASNSSPGFP